MIFGLRLIKKIGLVEGNDIEDAIFFGCLLSEKGLRSEFSGRFRQKEGWILFQVFIFGDWGWS